MNSLQLPTVRIIVRNGSLVKSTVYYVLLEDESGSFPLKKIVGIMFSDPSIATRRTQFAELLPLEVAGDGRGGYSIRPLLIRERYKQLISNGCLLKVLAVEAGRCTEDSKTLPWNHWKPSFPAMRSTITKILQKDIRKIPASIIDGATVSNAQNCSNASIIDRATVSNAQNCSNICSSLKGDVHRNMELQDKPKQDLSKYYPNLRFSGLAASGGSSFAKWFNVIPPNIHIDKNFKCDRGTTLRKDNFLDSRTFYKYLNLTESD